MVPMVKEDDGRSLPIEEVTTPICEKHNHESHVRKSYWGSTWTQCSTNFRCVESILITLLIINYRIFQVIFCWFLLFDLALGSCIQHILLPMTRILQFSVLCLGYLSTLFAWRTIISPFTKVLKPSSKLSMFNLPDSQKHASNIKENSINPKLGEFQIDSSGEESGSSQPGKS